MDAICTVKMRRILIIMASNLPVSKKCEQRRVKCLKLAISFLLCGPTKCLFGSFFQAFICIGSKRLEIDFNIQMICLFCLMKCSNDEARQMKRCVVQNTTTRKDESDQIITHMVKTNRQKKSFEQFGYSKRLNSLVLFTAAAKYFFFLILWISLKYIVGFVDFTVICK